MTPDDITISQLIRYVLILRLAIYTSMTWFFVPFMAIVILYCGIVFKVRKSNLKKMAKLQQTELTGGTNHEQETLTSGDTVDGAQNKK
jgi:hypothetical protein